MSEEQLYAYCKNKTVLIVDKDELSYQLLLELLSDYNFRILYAENGDNALRLFKENPSIIMVLMEIKLPVLDGFTVLKKFRELNPSILVIAQTAYVLCEMEIKIKDAGFDDYISKPISINLFSKMIKKHLLSMLMENE